MAGGINIVEHTIFQAFDGKLTSYQAYSRELTSYQACAQFIRYRFILTPGPFCTNCEPVSCQPTKTIAVLPVLPNTSHTCHTQCLILHMGVFIVVTCKLET